ncbi:Glycerate 2-kinase [Nitrospira sp. KM1]|uniref:glycerate kinase type-2 family protein n=1 Tax=Nitrospira sp. KM1 TaxID=1936990 RepID=UPI0013A78A37|nr:glycerate kinase [Nitrospira sp. KM1]BCA55639.1 Glycerate 2-kinase [Nitrospira sp. KM1]
MTIHLPASRASSLLKVMVGRALKAVDAGAAVRREVTRNGDRLAVGSRRYDLRRYERIVVIGAGKATATMARMIERILGPKLDGGLVIVKYGHGLPTRRVRVVEAAHPLPDRAGQAAALRLLAMAASLSKRDLLIVLLSGGASSLMPAPVPGVTLADKQRVSNLLLRSGATISEINTVRKHLSRLKGGRLVESTAATVVTIILSDVLGDDVSSIASGPTVPDPTTYQQAVECLKRYRIWTATPRSVRAYLEKGAKGLLPETPKAGNRAFRRARHLIVGSNAVALAAVTRVAREAGLRTVLQSPAVTGEARVAGARFAAIAQRIVRRDDPVRRPCCVVAGGETTVTVKGNGTGGRAQEFAAGAAQGIAGLKNVWVAAIGTDGTDGPTDAAGAVVSGETIARAKRLHVDLDLALRLNDTYPALSNLKCLVKTGATGTNVNDLYLLLLL